MCKLPSGGAPSTVLLLLDPALLDSSLLHLTSHRTWLPMHCPDPIALLTLSSPSACPASYITPSHHATMAGLLFVYTLQCSSESRGPVTGPCWAARVYTLLSWCFVSTYWLNKVLQNCSTFASLTPELGLKHDGSNLMFLTVHPTDCPRPPWGPLGSVALCLYPEPLGISVQSTRNVHFPQTIMVTVRPTQVELSELSGETQATNS
jgi:hypothetical protein